MYLIEQTHSVAAAAAVVVVVVIIYRSLLNYFGFTSFIVS
jgi:hypothetical protein